MNTLIDHLTPGDGDTELVGSRIGRINPDNFTSQSGRGDGPTAMEDDAETEANGLFDEPADEDGEHDYHQDDNYALGGHVTRSGSV